MGIVTHAASDDDVPQQGNDIPLEVLEMLDEFDRDVAAGRLTEADVEELNRILDQAQPE